MKPLPRKATSAQAAMKPKKVGYVNFDGTITMIDYFPPSKTCVVLGDKKLLNK